MQVIARGGGVAFRMAEVLNSVDAVPRRIAFEMERVAIRRCDDDPVFAASPRPVPCGEGGDSARI
jgi:hypothetical protein